MDTKIKRVRRILRILQGTVVVYAIAVVLFACDFIYTFYNR